MGIQLSYCYPKANEKGQELLKEANQWVMICKFMLPSSTFDSAHQWKHLFHSIFLFLTVHHWTINQLKAFSPTCKYSKGN